MTQEQKFKTFMDPGCSDWKKHHASEMSKVIITPSVLSGTVQVPPSKSDVHRAVICAALSKGVCRIAPVVFSNDIKATVSCMQALGASINYDMQKKMLTVDGSNLFNTEKPLLNCGESGSTLRFLIPVAGTADINTVFSGEGLLPQRPIDVLLGELTKAGVFFEKKSKLNLPLQMSGKLQSGRFELPGNISSQFVTGLLFALPLLSEDSEIVLTSPIESKGYIDMTIETMSRFGVSVQETEQGYFVHGKQQYKPTDYTAEGDWSQAAFFMVSGALQGEITVLGVDYFNSKQGDKKIVDILKAFGAEVRQGDGPPVLHFKTEKQSPYFHIKKGKLNGITVDASQIPDLIPVIAVAAAKAQGTTNIINAGRLRLKESDRLHAVAVALNNIGAKVREQPDGLIIEGTDSLKGGYVEGCNDHRIVMALSIAGTVAEGNTIITDAFCINKSYPSFFDDFGALGGNFTDLSLIDRRKYN